VFTVIHFFTIIFGLALFEVITSIDNAVVNANVLKTLAEKYFSNNNLFYQFVRSK
jgi:hypothetical protein